MPQICASTLVKSDMWWRQAPASKSSSRAMPGRQCTSRPQPAGQASTHSRHAPQLLSRTGSPAGSSRSVKTVARRTAGPNYRRDEEGGLADPAHARRRGRRLVRERLVAVGLFHGGPHALGGVAVHAQHVHQRPCGVVQRHVHAQVLLLVVRRGPVPQAAHHQRVESHEHGDRRRELRRRQRQRRVVGGDTPGVHLLGAEDLPDGVPVENVQHETSSDGRWGGETMVAPGPFHPRIGASTATMDGGGHFHCLACPNWTPPRPGEATEKREPVHNHRLFPLQAGYPRHTPTREGGETMGPVHFNKTKVKQEDRYGKRRK